MSQSASQSSADRGPRWRRLLPGLGALLGYRRSWLGGDLLAGVTVAAYLVPQVRAYAVVAGLPPVAGLWAILPALALHALLGSSRVLSVGPESTTALMTATVVGPLAAGNPARYAVLAATLTIAVGLLCVALDALDDLRRELDRRGIVLALARVKQDLLEDLTAYGLVDTVGGDRVFPTLPTAVAAYRTWGRDR